MATSPSLSNDGGIFDSHNGSDDVPIDGSGTSTDDDANDEPKLLAIMGRYFPFYPDYDGIGRVPLTAGDGICELVVKEVINGTDESGAVDGGTGLSVWDGSMLCARYLEARPELVRSKRVLELGSGPGLVGIAAAVLGADRVVLTDLPYALPLARENAESNMALWKKSTMDTTIDHDVGGDEQERPSRVRMVECRECDWFQPPSLDVLFPSEESLERTSDRSVTVTVSEVPDLILVADCVWIASLVPPLLETVHRYVSPEDHGRSPSDAISPLVIFTYQRRGKDAHEAFMDGIHHVFESVTDVDTAQVCGLDKPDVFHVFECRKPRERKSR